MSTIFCLYDTIAWIVDAMIVYGFKQEFFQSIAEENGIDFELLQYFLRYILFICLPYFIIMIPSIYQIWKSIIKNYCREAISEAV